MIIGAAPELKTLWPHASTYCVLLKNYTPTRALHDGKTPHQALLEAVGHLKPVPNLYNLRQWGEVGWIHIPKQTRQKGAKVAPRACKGFFIGLKGLRIFLMYHSVTRTIVCTSSVDFNQFAEVREEPDEYIDINRPAINLDHGIASAKPSATTPGGILERSSKASSPEIPNTPYRTQSPL
jgi:hypothetical protein